ncbi:chemotaxis protein CheW [Pilimelia columellifera]|uniref:CheW-like domain-containing protein n=1 Tax=Pilimelia columellifera subsp. columellifera TaxID=706583 RepID=A0ABN3NLN5_9ACTN
MSVIGKPTARRSSLLFRAGALLCGVPMEDVVETMRPLPVRPLAGLPPHLLGVGVVRGRPTPVVDVAVLVTDRHAEPSRFLVVRGERGPVALTTGPVLGVGEVTSGRGDARLVSSVAAIDVRGDEPVLLLTLANLVPDEVWAALPADWDSHGDPG